MVLEIAIQKLLHISDAWRVYMGGGYFAESFKLTDDHSEDREST